MSIYDELQPVVAGIMKEFKTGVIKYIDVAPGNGPADNPGPATRTPYDIDAALRGIKFKYVQDGLAVASDLQLSMSVHPTITPDIRGFIEADGVPYKIVHVIPKPAAGTPVAFTLIIKK